MKKTKPINYAEFRQLLEGLGYQLNRTDSGDIFRHSREGVILLRHYRDNEKVDPGDLLYTRKFLDLRGLLEEADFDTFIQRANKPA
jgi:hypothetical protein